MKNTKRKIATRLKERKKKTDEKKKRKKTRTSEVSKKLGVLRPVNLCSYIRVKKDQKEERL